MFWAGSFEQEGGGASLWLELQRESWPTPCSGQSPDGRVPGSMTVTVVIISHSRGVCEDKLRGPVCRISQNCEAQKTRPQSMGPERAERFEPEETGRPPRPGLSHRLLPSCLSLSPLFLPQSESEKTEFPFPKVGHRH